MKYGILVETFSNVPNFDFEELTDQNLYLYKAIREMLNDNNLNQHYRMMSQIKTEQYNLENYKNKLKDIVNEVISHQ